MFVSSSWLKFEGGPLWLLNKEWGSPILVVMLFALIMRIDCCIRCGRVASDDPRGVGTLAVSGSPLRAVIPFVSAAKCCGNSYAGESGSTAKV